MGLNSTYGRQATWGAPILHTSYTYLDHVVYVLPRRVNTHVYIRTRRVNTYVYIRIRRVNTYTTRAGDVGRAAGADGSVGPYAARRMYTSAPRRYVCIYTYTTRKCVCIHTYTARRYACIYIRIRRVNTYMMREYGYDASRRRGPRRWSRWWRSTLRATTSSTSSSPPVDPRFNFPWSRFLIRFEVDSSSSSS